LVSFGSEAAKYGLAPGDEVIAVLAPADRPNRYWFVVPALLLLAANAGAFSQKSQSRFSGREPSGQSQAQDSNDVCDR
jgi:hypothetical protein